AARTFKRGFGRSAWDASMYRGGTGEPASTTGCRLCQRAYVGSTSAQTGRCRAGRWSCELRSVVEPELGLRWVPRRCEGRRCARAPALGVSRAPCSAARAHTHGGPVADAAWYRSSFGELRLWLSRISTDRSRDLVVHSPSAGPDHVVQDRGPTVCGAHALHR